MLNHNERYCRIALLLICGFVVILVFVLQKVVSCNLAIFMVYIYDAYMYFAHRMNELSNAYMQTILIQCTYSLSVNYGRFCNLS